MDNGRHWYWSGEGCSLWYASLNLIYQRIWTGWAGPFAEGARLTAEETIA